MLPSCLCMQIPPQEAELSQLQLLLVWEHQGQRDEATQSKRKCSRCRSFCWVASDCVLAPRQVDFIWINRDQKSFEWFVSLLTKLEMDQADEEPEGKRQAPLPDGAGSSTLTSLSSPLPGRFLEMHMYMTSALSKNDMKAIGLQMALDLLAKKEKRDSITGLRTRTQPGRPEWAKVRSAPSARRLYLMYVSVGQLSELSEGLLCVRFFRRCRRKKKVKSTFSTAAHLLWPKSSKPNVSTSTSTSTRRISEDGLNSLRACVSVCACACVRLWLVPYPALQSQYNLACCVSCLLALAANSCINSSHLCRSHEESSVILSFSSH